MKWILFTLLFLSLSAFGSEATPTVRVYQSLSFADDMQFSNLNLAIQRQLRAYDVMGLEGTIRFGTKSYPKKVLKESLLLLKDLATDTKVCLETHSEEVCFGIFNREANKRFAIYRPVPKRNEAGYRKAKTTKFTSYYSPDLHGSRVPTQRFKNPIYSLPALSHRNYTRTEIDFHGALVGLGYEIFWVEDSFFDLYLLHVQGGGRMNVYLPDGSREITYLSYQGKNNRSFQMIYKYMLKKGYLTRATAGVPNQRKFLEENPDKQEEIFNSCPSYIYFKESEDEPVGLDNIPLTEGRSVALDSGIYKTTGIINFVKTVKASHVNQQGRVVKTPFSRFFISQDTGGAIKGNARCDLYFGYGPLAELTAYNMNDMGEQYFLIKK